MHTNIENSLPHIRRNRWTVPGQLWLVIATVFAGALLMLGAFTLISSAAEIELAQRAAMDTPVSVDLQDVDSVLGFRLGMSKEALPDPDGVRLVGDTVVFRVELRNEDPSLNPVSFLPLRDTYSPTWLSYVNASPPPQTVTTGMLEWEDLIGISGVSLGPGETTSVFITFTALATGVTTNTAVVQGAYFQGSQVPENAGPVYASVEIYELDYGDAPDPQYPTLLASNGARHVINPTFHLGQLIDGELNGQPNATATGDDNANLADEDGVMFNTSIVPGQIAGVTVTASAPGILNAWFDFNGDGDWADAGEQIFIDQALVTGPNALSFSVPAGATSGITFARFRFSSVGGLSFEGLAPDGEVEDYQVQVEPPNTPTPTCPCGPDQYEPDDTQAQARPFPLNGTRQTHTFHVAADVDWYRFDGLVPGWSYNIRTSNLTPGTDTYMILYDQNNQVVKTNDDIDTALCLTLPQFCASTISWTATYSSPYYLRVQTLTYPDSHYPVCYCPGYDITGKPLRTWAPIIPGPLPEATLTPTPTHTPTATPTRTPPVEPTTIPVPGLLHPKGLAVNPQTHLIYVTGRDNNRLYVVDGFSFAVIDEVMVGREPWGVDVNPNTNKVYVANFASRNVYVLDATTRALLNVIDVGPNPTFVKVNPITNFIFVPTYGNDAVAIINGYTDTVVGFRYIGGGGTWGVAVNPNLNRVYISVRDTDKLVTLDGNDNFRVMDDQTIHPCGGTGAALYGMDFNPVNNKLYVACAPRHNVNKAAVFQASASGLTRLAYIDIGNGGADGGGGVTVDTTTGNAFITNSYDNTVSVISGTSNAVIATIPVGLNPFGAAVDPVTKRVFVGNRDSNNLYAILDTYGP